jgi:hypothetical protein
LPRFAGALSRAGPESATERSGAEVPEIGGGLPEGAEALQRFGRWGDRAEIAHSAGSEREGGATVRCKIALPNFGKPAAAAAIACLADLVLNFEEKIGWVLLVVSGEGAAVGGMPVVEGEGQSADSLIDPVAIAISV